jgi:indole-3-glycerol phosphate synthase
MIFLGQILKNKKGEIRRLKRLFPMEVLKKEVARLPKKRPCFLAALRQKKPFSVIAEIKRRSPSKGLLRRAFDPTRLARMFEKAGASALSVLTDQKYFGGSALVLRQVKHVTRLPVLRKDFVIDEYQIWESRLLGADAVLLIAGILSREKLRDFSALSRRLGLETLVEVHGLTDLKKILPLKPRLIGINNRDLRTFRVDLRATAKLSRHLPRGTFLVSESGIQNRKDLLYLRRFGVRSVLVGETLMKHRNPAQALKSLLGD